MHQAQNSSTSVEKNQIETVFSVLEGKLKQKLEGLTLVLIALIIQIVVLILAVASYYVYYDDRRK